MSVRPHKSAQKRAMTKTWRFWMDKQGRLRRVCRCEWCVPQRYRRESFDWRREVDA